MNDLMVCIGIVIGGALVASIVAWGAFEIAAWKVSR